MRSALEGYRKVHAYAKELAMNDCKARGLDLNGFCGLVELDCEGRTIYIIYEWQSPDFYNTDVNIQRYCLRFTENEFCQL